LLFVDGLFFVDYSIVQGHCQGVFFLFPFCGMMLDMIGIYGTLGPSCAREETLYKMFEAGMQGIRLNLSHAGLSEYEEQLSLYFSAARRFGLSDPGLIIDTQGPELRTGILKEPIFLETGSLVSLGEGGIPVNPGIFEPMKPGQEVLLDDGRIRLLAERTEKDRGEFRVLRGGLLKSRKSIALPGLSIHTPVLTGADLENIRLAPEYGVTGLMQSFVRSREDLRQIRGALDAAGGEHIRIYAKVENRQGLAQLPSILPHADVLVIARGDLGNSMPLWELPRVQKEIAALCRRASKPFMVATQLLYTMEHAGVPTRAEVSDVFNAVLDGAASLLLTGETAAGDYPIEAIRYLTNTAREAESFRSRTMSVSGRN